MAPKGVKRAAAKAPAEEPGAKRVADFLKQQGVSKASFQPALALLEHPLAELPEATQSLLLATLPWSLAVPADLRHEAQQGVVNMVDEVANAVHAKLQQHVELEVTKVDELESSKAALTDEVEHAEVAALEAGTLVQECKDRFSEAEAEVTDKQVASNDIDAEVKQMDAQLEETRTLAGQFEDVLSSAFPSLREGGFEESEAQGLVDRVMAIVSKSNLEESLTATLPPCLAKRERGSFDLVVMGQAEEALRAKATAVKEALGQPEEQLSVRKAAAQAACADLQAASVAQAEAAAQLSSAQEASKAALEKAAEAKLAVSNFEANLAEAKSKLEKKRSELDTFSTYDLFMFQLLRDQTSKKPSPEQAAEAPTEQPVEQVEEPAVDAASEPAEKSAHEPVADAHMDSSMEISETLPAKAIEQIGQETVTALAGVAGA